MQDQTPKLSVALAVYNEESNIKACLETVQGFADEIVVVDGTSSDNTAKIAREMGATVMVVENQKNFHKNKQAAAYLQRPAYSIDSIQPAPPEARVERLSTHVKWSVNR